VKTPVDSTIYSAPVSPHGISSGFLQILKRPYQLYQSKLLTRISTGKGKEKKTIIPDTKNSNRLLSEEKCLRILNLKLMMFPLTMNCIILKHICLQTARIHQIQKYEHTKSDTRRRKTE
jgi:hypothetical protein